MKAPPTHDLLEFGLDFLSFIHGSVLSGIKEGSRHSVCWQSSKIMTSPSYNLSKLGIDSYLFMIVFLSILRGASREAVDSLYVGSPALMNSASHTSQSLDFILSYLFVRFFSILSGIKEGYRHVCQESTKLITSWQDFARIWNKDVQKLVSDQAVVQVLRQLHMTTTDARALKSLLVRRT